MAPEIPYWVQRLLENQCEFIRKVRDSFLQLKSCADYGVYSTFKLLDTDNTNYFGKEEVRRFMGACKRFVGSSEVGCLLRVFDRDGDGKVSFKDYMDTIINFEPLLHYAIPRPVVEHEKEEKPVATPEKKSRGSTQKAQGLLETPSSAQFSTPSTLPTLAQKSSAVSRFSLKGIISAHAELERRAEDARLALCSLMEPAKVFQLFCEGRKESFVNLGDLKSGLGDKFSVEDLSTLFPRYDTDRDGTLSEAEFVAILRPAVPCATQGTELVSHLSITPR